MAIGKDVFDDDLHEQVKEMLIVHVFFQAFCDEFGINHEKLTEKQKKMLLIIYQRCGDVLTDMPGTKKLAAEIVRELKINATDFELN